MCTETREHDDYREPLNAARAGKAEPERNPWRSIKSCQDDLLHSDWNMNILKLWADIFVWLVNGFYILFEPE